MKKPDMLAQAVKAHMGKAFKKSKAKEKLMAYLD